MIHYEKFKGISYNTVIRNNMRKGGKINKFDIIIDNNIRIVTIETDYANGLSISEEKLFYKQDILQTWTIQFNNQKKPKLVFSRKEYNKLIQDKKQRVKEIV